MIFVDFDRIDTQYVVTGRVLLAVEKMLLMPLESKSHVVNLSNSLVVMVQFQFRFFN